jgi:N6-adenosine-specific RNA methylase IME4
MNRTGKMAPEHKRLSRYGTMTMEEIYELPVATIAAEKSHLYLWCPNALLAEVLFGIRGKNNRTLQPGRTQVNLINTRKRRHSQKPDEMWDIVERCSSGPRLEMFARHYRHGWHQWGDQVEPPPLTLVKG